MKAIIWGYEYNDMLLTWVAQMKWLINSLQKYGVEVKLQDLKCTGVKLPKYNCIEDNPCDIVVYNHTDLAMIGENICKSKENWFFKPTVPDEVHTTLDTWGYGPYSSITYEKPNFEKEEIGDFFETKVKSWIDGRTTKWGSDILKEKEIEAEDYWLVLGQCGGDSVVTRYDFGNYFTKLEQVVRELYRISDKKIIVKLHPYTDGKDAKDNVFSNNIKERIESISTKYNKITVFNDKSNIHSFVKGARAIFLANSGAGFEAMMHHKPIIAWGYPEYHWTSYDLRHLVDLRRAIKLDWFDKDTQDKFLYWYMEKYCFYNQETADNRVKELLIALNGRSNG
jgi:hypothetical protein